MSDKNIKPYQFINFDSLEKKEETDPLLKFKIGRKKDFIPQFKRKSKYEFRNLFSEKGELTVDDYKKDVEEFYKTQKNKAELAIKKYLEEKRKEADLIIKNAQENAKKIEKEAYEKGYNDGFQKGINDSKNEIKEELEVLSKLINKLVSFEKDILKENENGIINLIIKFAKKIIKKELEINSNEILYENLKYILNKIVDKGYLEIKINPDQYQFIEKHLETFKDLYQLKEVKISKSGEIAQGDCIIETNFGNYESRIEEQINELEKALTYKN